MFSAWCLKSAPETVKAFPLLLATLHEDIHSLPSDCSYYLDCDLRFIVPLK